MKHEKIDTDVELLRLTTAGSVDDGKSTLIGRLLYDCQAIFEDQLSAVEKTSKKMGKDTDLALLLDGLAAEREQGITIDVAYRYFATPKRKFIIADVPGHEQYTRNMVTGASTASLAMILIDARKGLLIQSKRHLFVASLLRIPHIIIVVNKMDLMDYEQGVYEKIKEEVIDYAAKMNIVDLQFVPVSALVGDMVVERGGNMNWYQGPTLLSSLENVQVVSDRNLIDFRFPVQTVIRPNQDFRGYAGMVEGGSVKVGEEVMILPSGVESKVSEISVAGNETDYTFSPQSSVISLEDEVDISRGDMIVRKKNLPNMGTELDALVCWFGDDPMQVDKRYLLKHTTNVTPMFIDDLQYKIDIDTLHRDQGAKGLDLNEIGRVNVRTTNPVMFDAYAQNRNTGSFIIIDELTNNTVGAGIIVDKGKRSDYVRQGAKMKAQKGAILWFTGLSGSGKSTISEKLMGFLVERGLPCEHLDGDFMRETLSRDLGFSKEDRYENINRVSVMSNLLAKHGVIVVASFISPYREQRDALRKKSGKFIEIFVNTPLEVCEGRDVKGLYKKARAGEIEFFTGISDPYEEPIEPEIDIKTEEEPADEAVERIVEYMFENGYLTEE